MNLLLDTHIALWLVTQRQTLTLRESRALNHLDNRVFVSAVSIWELRIKWDTLTTEGDRKGPADPRHVVKALDLLGVTLVPLDPQIAAIALREPVAHRDPFDVQLLIEAQERQMRLMTRDEKLLGHPLVFVPL